NSGKTALGALAGGAAGAVGGPRRNAVRSRSCRPASPARVPGAVGPGPPRQPPTRPGSTGFRSSSGGGVEASEPSGERDRAQPERVRERSELRDLVALQELAGDHDLLDLAGALADQQE